MRQIELYYTEDLKYLKLGDYIKNFENNESIDDMLSCIKNKEQPVKIRTSKENIVRHKLSNNFKVIYSYEEIMDDKIFDYTLLEEDIDSGVAYSSYKVMSEKYKDVLGEEIYFCRNREILRYIVKNRDALAFLFEDLPELRKNLQKTGNIGERLTVQMFFEDCEDACGCV